MTILLPYQLVVLASYQLDVVCVCSALALPLASLGLPPLRGISPTSGQTSTRGGLPCAPRLDCPASQCAACHRSGASLPKASPNLRPLHFTCPVLLCSLAPLPSPPDHRPWPPSIRRPSRPGTAWARMSHTVSRTGASLPGRAPEAQRPRSAGNSRAPPPLLRRPRRALRFSALAPVAGAALSHCAHSILCGDCLPCRRRPSRDRRPTLPLPLPCVAPGRPPPSPPLGNASPGPCPSRVPPCTSSHVFPRPFPLGCSSGALAPPPALAAPWRWPRRT